MAVLLNIPKGENNTYLEFFVTDVPGTWWIDSEEKDQGWPSKLPEDRELLFRLELDILDSLVAASGIRWPLGEYFWDRYDSRTEDGRSSIQFWVEHFEKMATKISETPSPALLEKLTAGASIVLVVQRHLKRSARTSSTRCTRCEVLSVRSLLSRRHCLFWVYS